MSCASRALYKNFVRDHHDRGNWLDGDLDELRGRKSGFSEGGDEVLAIRKGGSEFPVTVSFGAVVVAGKRLFFAIVHDITDRVRTEVALQAGEYQLRQISDSVPALIVYLDRDERYLFHDKAMVKSLGRASAPSSEKRFRKYWVRRCTKTCARM